MRFKGFFWALPLGLLFTAFYALYAETEIPDMALQSIRLLKKPIEELLPDIQDEDTSQAVEQATLELQAYQDLHNERERWNEMRSLIESGQPLFSPLPSEIAVSTSPIGRLAPAVPPPVGFTVQLPYESRLTVSGRKTIGMIYRSTQFSNASFATTQGVPTGQSSFELQQSLQVRINGQIGRKVTVNVDFDDTKTDKKDISIVYKGDPDEVVQRAAFGDINLSLPQTEFAGYSKQVFGASAELKYKALKGYFIGSRTKGETETKEFVGNIILQRVNIPDTSYIRHRFYNYTKLAGAAGDKGIDITKLKIYLDTQDSTRQGPQFSTMTVDLTQIPAPIAVTTTTYNGRFQLLLQGVDYTVDTSSGLITFKNVLSNIAVVAIDYLPPGVSDTSKSVAQTRGVTSTSPPNDTSGCSSPRGFADAQCVPGVPKAIKWDETQITQIPGTEELTHYTIGATKIVRDNGQGNFTLQLHDLGNLNIGPTVGMQYLPNNSGQIVVDFETGLFTLTRRLDTADSKFSSVYNFTPQTQSSFFLEYRSRVKTYTLRPNIILNSEHITMDGRTLVRDVDYFIDYASGFLTFFNEDQITDNTRIIATYDFSPFGIAGVQQDTLVGARGEVSLSPVSPILASSLIGSTVLYDFAPKLTAAPDIRQTSGSWLVTEADMHLKDLIFNPLPLLKSSFSGEIARSVRNPNTFGKALIDNMEGIKDETSVNMSKLNWQIAANPVSPGETFLNAIGKVTLVNPGDDNLDNERIQTLSINPNAAALSGDQTEVLDIKYNLSQSSEASIASVLSPTGLDFSKKLYVEMWMQGDGTAAGSTPTGTQINVTLGQISENFDGHSTGVLTEDSNHNNSLDANEDTGIPYINPDGTTVTLGNNNHRIDSNDLDRNGVRDPENPSVGGTLGYDTTGGAGNPPVHIPGCINFSSTNCGDPATANRIDFSGWKFVRVPLNISSDTASAAQWSAVKELRISLKADPTASLKTGVLRVAKIVVVGNRWQTDSSEIPFASSASITAGAINSEDDSTYVSPAGQPDFDELNQINTALTGPTPTKRKEQSLFLDYNFAVSGATVPTTITAKSVTVSPMDFTQYGSIRFFIRRNSTKTSGDHSKTSFIFRAGSDTDYWQYKIPFSELNTLDNWQEIIIRQPGGNRATGWDPSDPHVSSLNHPDLSSVAQLKFGVENEVGGGTPQGELWIDELHAGDANVRTGHATSLKSDFELYGWGTFGGGARNIDRNFETFTSGITNQDRREQNEYLTISRLAWFPMKFTGTQSHTITPAINTVGSTLVSFMQQGDVKQRAFSGSGTLQIPKLPRFGLAYDDSKTDTSLLSRTDMTNNYGVTMDYTVPVQRAYLPRTIALGYKLSKLKINYGADAAANAPDPSQISNTKDDTYDMNAKMAFQPLPGFTFNPNFARSVTRETKDIVGSTNPVVAGSTPSITSSTSTISTREYDKLKSQTMGFDGVMTFKRWFAPRLRYTITNRETYGIPLATDLNAADFKTVDRTSTGEGAWDFAWRDFSRKIRPIQSLNIVSSYVIEDGDTWQKVSGGYNSLNSFTVRSPLKTGEITNSTTRNTFRSTQRLNPFDWATYWTGSAQPLRTMSLTHTFTNTSQRQNTTGTETIIHTQIFPDLIIGMTQTEYFFHAERWMSNSQMNIKTQYKSVDTVGTTLEKASSNGGDWRFTLFKKLDLFVTYTRTSDNLFDRINNVTTSDSHGEVLGTQLGFNVGKWRFTPKYDQTKQQTVDSSGRLTVDQLTRTPALQVYADLFLPAGLKLPFGDLVVFSNRIRTTDTLSLEQRRSSLDELNSNTDTYKFTTSNDYELTSNVRLSVGGSYFYVVNKVSSDANSYGYEFNSLLTIQF